jgi:hypothetical protein
MTYILYQAKRQAWQKRCSQWEKLYNLGVLLSSRSHKRTHCLFDSDLHIGKGKVTSVLLIKPKAMKTSGTLRYSFTHTYPRHQMEESACYELESFASARNRTPIPRSPCPVIPTELSPHKYASQVGPSSISVCCNDSYASSFILIHYEVVPVLNWALRHEDVWGSGCTDPRILDLGSFTPLPLCPRYPLDRSPRVRLDDVKKRKLMTLSGLELHS